MALNFWSISEGKGAPSIFRTVDGYVRSGWDVHVVMRAEKTNFGSSPENLHIYNFEFPFLKKLVGVRRLSTPAALALWAFSHRKFLRMGARVLGSHDIGVVYAYEADGVAAARKLADRYHKPLVTRFMGTVLSDKLKSLKYRLILPHHFRALKTRADLVIMTNDGSRGLWTLRQLKNPSPDIRFWMNGVNHADLSGYDEAQLRAELLVPQGCRTLLCVSRLVGWKRLDRSLRAFQKILGGFEGDLRLVIVGDGDARPDLEKLANELGIADSTVFAGGLPQSKVYHVMRFADVFLSLYDISNMGNPLFEAMRAGKPIVTLDNGDTATIIRDGENGLLLPASSDVDDIASAVLCVLRDESLRTRLAQGAAEYAGEHFWTWDERIAEEVGLVGKLL